jgi:hypothetical protein
MHQKGDLRGAAFSRIRNPPPRPICDSGTQHELAKFAVSLFLIDAVAHSVPWKQIRAVTDAGLVIVTPTDEFEITILLLGDGAYFFSDLRQIPDPG